MEPDITRPSTSSQQPIDIIPSSLVAEDFITSPTTVEITSDRDVESLETTAVINLNDTISDVRTT